LLALLTMRHKAEAAGLMEKQKVGREFVFTPAPDIVAKLGVGR